MDPITAIATCVNSSIKIFEVTYQLKGVDEQTADLLSTANHVNHNIKEARRLSRAKTPLLSLNERAWIARIISDTEDALRNIEELIEPARVDRTTTSKQSIDLKNKVLWVFRDNPKVRDKHARLIVCHQSLTAVITTLHAKGPGCEAYAAEEGKEGPPPYDPQMVEFFNWSNQKRRRKSSVNIRSDGVPTSPASVDSASSKMMTTSPSTNSSLSPMHLECSSTSSLPIIKENNPYDSTITLPIFAPEPFDFSFESTTSLPTFNDTSTQIDTLTSPSVLSMPDFDTDTGKISLSDLGFQVDEPPETQIARHCYAGSKGVRRGRLSGLAFHASREDVQYDRG